MRTLLAASATMAAALAVAELQAAPKLPAIFQDHMVLQMEASVPVWGKANAGEEVAVEFAGQRKAAKADANGRWQVKLDPLKPSSAPQEMRVEGESSFVVEDVLVGEVWLASGQSNMWFHLNGVAEAEKEIKDAKFGGIREFGIPQSGDISPREEVEGTWKVCEPSAAKDFSAVAYFFARRLHVALGVPIGIIRSAYCGSTAEAWISVEALSSDPSFGPLARERLRRKAEEPGKMAEFPAKLAAWEAKYDVADGANEGEANGWAGGDVPLEGWTKAKAGFTWAKALGAKSGGVFWARKEFDLPEQAAGKPFKLSLGYLDKEYDAVYFNGAKVGSIGRNPPDFYSAPRDYNIPGFLVRAGRNAIAARFVSHTESGGLFISGKAMRLPVEDPRKVDDEWLLRSERLFPPLPSEALKCRPEFASIAIQRVDAAVFNAMISPIQGYGIKGAIWFQGEDNATSLERAKAYERTLRLLVADWRGRWGTEFPFLIVQLTNFGAVLSEDCRAHKTHPLSILREEQEKASKSIPRSGLAVAIDLGEDFTVHPGNKKDVGERLALLALDKACGSLAGIGISEGPYFKGSAVEGSSIRVSFAIGASPLMAGKKNGLAPVEDLGDAPLTWFEIAGEDGVFVWADARITGSDTVDVSSPQVSNPRFVRYAWAANAKGCNLYNKAGFPAAPFRSSPKDE